MPDIFTLCKLCKLIDFVGFSTEYLKIRTCNGKLLYIDDWEGDQNILYYDILFVLYSYCPPIKPNYIKDNDWYLISSRINHCEFVLA